MQEPSTGYMTPISEADAEAIRKENPRVTCVLNVGQRVELEGGTFRVRAIGKRYVQLEGVPGTRVGAD